MLRDYKASQTQPDVLPDTQITPTLTTPTRPSRPLNASSNFFTMQPTVVLVALVSVGAVSAATSGCGVDPDFAAVRTFMPVAPNSTVRPSYDATPQLMLIRSLQLPTSQTS